MEIAFGWLKARWRRFCKQNDMSVENVPCVVAACCVLHNICEVHGDAFDDDWTETDDNTNQTAATSSTTSTADGLRVREALIEYFENNPS